MHYRLRELQKKDLPVINQWRNDPELIAQLGAPYRFINLDVDTTWYDSYMSNRSTTVRCAVVGKDTDEILGLASLVSIDHMNQSAEFHIMVGSSENQGKGIGTFAVREMLHHAFDNLNLQRVELIVLENNDRARHLYEKVGFIQEGVKRNSKFKKGRFVNMVIYSILKSEFYSRGGGILQIPNQGTIPLHSYCWLHYKKRICA